jgi:hypothetical protein
MSNPRGKPPTDTEAIAFAVVGQVLGVDVDHADADGTPSSVDGRWTYPDGRRAALEVTAPEASKEIGERVRAERRGEQVFLNGTVELGNLSEQISSILAEPWAAPNIAKLRATGADETHLYLWGLGLRDDFLFATMSDLLPSVAPLLPDGLTDLWLDAWVFRDEGPIRNVTVVHYNDALGWSTRHASYDESALPARQARKIR